MPKKSQTKKDLVEQIKLLIDKNKETQINTKYIDYFEIDELIEIRDSLEFKKSNNEKETLNYLDNIFSKCS